MLLHCWWAVVTLVALRTRLSAGIDHAPPCEHLQVPTVDNDVKISLDTSVSCRDITPFEILSAMKWLTAEPSASHAGCRDIDVISNFPVCNDASASRVEKVDTKCIVYIVHGDSCGLSSVEVLAEHWLQRNCVVRYIVPYQQGSCLTAAKSTNIHTTYKEMISWHKKLPTVKELVNILYLDDDKGRGLQLLSMLYTTPPLFRVSQFSWHLKYGCTDIKNSEFGISRGWSLWALHYYLRSNGYVSDYSTARSGAILDQPNCFSSTALGLVGLDISKCCYHVLFRKRAQQTPLVNMHLPPAADQNKSLARMVDLVLENELFVKIPSYCMVPGGNKSWVDTELRLMHSFVKKTLSAHCPDAAYTCRHTSQLNPLTPCLRDISLAIAEDYAWSKGWCHAQPGLTDIESLDGLATQAGQLASYIRSTAAKATSARLFFCIFAHDDILHLERLLNRIFNVNHSYLIVVDKGEITFFNLVSEMIAMKFPRNVAAGNPEHIIYKTSSISRLAAKILKWSLQYIPAWDSVVFLTGSDYPLIPLSRIEEKLNIRRGKADILSLMAWGWTPDYHKMNISTTAKKALTHFFDERQSLSPLRGSHQFGIPLTCGGQRLFARFPNRISSKPQSPYRYSTQWLFNIDKANSRISSSVDDDVRLPMDKKSRLWMKSDPATSSVIDRESAEYIVNSEEGMRYYHFFKHTLVGAEEHYFISLLGNWKMRGNSVKEVERIPIVNSWNLGRIRSTDVSRRNKHEKTVHTSYLGLEEFEFLKGLSEVGVFFARKFSTSLADILNIIDNQFLLNSSSLVQRTKK